MRPLDAQKGPEGPFARLPPTDYFKNINRCQAQSDLSQLAPWVWMTASH
jgi:hypothetical protein